MGCPPKKVAVMEMLPLIACVTNEAFPLGFGAKTQRPRARKMALVSFLARLKLKIPFLGLSLLRNQTETLATQARPLVEARLYL